MGSFLFILVHAEKHSRNGVGKEAKEIQEDDEAEDPLPLPPCMCKFFFINGLRNRVL
jgi:hypothetical protein